MLSVNPEGLGGAGIDIKGRDALIEDPTGAGNPDVTIGYELGASAARRWPRVSGLTWRTK